MKPSLYLINPRTDYPAYYGAEVFHDLGLPTAAFVADLAVTTVAALAGDGFRVEVCDENAVSVRLEHEADYVGITGKVSQRERMLELAREFRARGKIVIIGGPYASLSPEQVREDCDILVTGEIEAIAGELFADLCRGEYRREYQGGPVDLAASPVPRWDLYPNDHALQGCVQTSRGCPFRCEFCDTIQYAGRNQRHKPVAQVLEELELLYGLGYRSAFLADDNFTAHRPRARALLGALRDWNAARDAGRMHFSTQISVDAAQRPELLALCADAGLGEAFVGIETPNEDSLAESLKAQNLRADPCTSLEGFVSQGVGVIGGLVVGFDADSPDIFEQQYEFSMRTPVPTLSVNALNAPPRTPLYDRLKLAGRLWDEKQSAGPVTPWWSNVRPKQMSNAALSDGVQWLVRELYRPAAFEQRVLRFIELFPEPESRPRTSGMPRREVNLQGASVVRALARLGKGEAAMLSRLSTAVRGRPETQRHVFADLFRYMQIRSIYTPRTRIFGS